MLRILRPNETDGELDVQDFNQLYKRRLFENWLEPLDLDKLVHVFGHNPPPDLATGEQSSSWWFGRWEHELVRMRLIRTVGEDVAKLWDIFDADTPSIVDKEELEKINFDAVIKPPEDSGLAQGEGSNSW